MHQNSTQSSRDTADRSQFMMHMSRRSMPPRFRPFMIIVMVLSLGCLFIGLTMTVIAHWPGYSAVGGNPLEIVGPVLLSVGLLAFVVGLIEVCRRTQQEKTQMQRSFATMHASRSAMQHSFTPTPSMDAKPQRSILKKTPSGSTYGRGSEYGESDSGVANTYPGHSQNMSYEPDNSENSADSQIRHEVFRIESMPDPVAARSKSQSSARNGPVENLQSSTDSEAQVPMPVRARSRDKKQQQAVTQQRPSYSNDAYSPEGPEETERKHRREMQSYGNEGYDAFAEQAHAQPTSAVEEKPKRHHRKHREPGEGSERRKKRRPKGGVPNEAYSPEKDDQPQSQRPPAGSAEVPLTTPIIQAMAEQQQPRSTQPTGASRQGDQPVRINIKAQPGTAVHITPGTPNMPAPAMAAPRPRQPSTETEI